GLGGTAGLRGHVPAQRGAGRERPVPDPQRSGLGLRGRGRRLRGRLVLRGAEPMSLVWRLAAALLLLPACSLDVASKVGCNSASDCDRGYVCVSHRCLLNSGAGGTGDAGYMSTIDGGPGEGPPSPRCTGDGVTACPPAGPRCEEIFCGG